MLADDCILKTESLTKSFGGFTAVSNVNLRVKRGTIHALIGPNGAGKTTCFNLLTKFLEPTAGHIKFNGLDITKEKPAQIAKRGIIRYAGPVAGGQAEDAVKAAEVRQRTCFFFSRALI